MAADFIRRRFSGPLHYAVQPAGEKEIRGLLEDLILLTNL